LEKKLGEKDYLIKAFTNTISCLENTQLLQVFNCFLEATSFNITILKFLPQEISYSTILKLIGTKSFLAFI